jgi:hypothetical protein
MSFTQRNPAMPVRVWCAPNQKVRMQNNWTMGRKVQPSPAMQIAAE